MVPQGSDAAPNSQPGATRTPSAPADADGAANLVAQQVFVTTGTTRGDQVAILKGVNEGDEVVTSGQIKLRNGALVTVNNSVQPSDDPNPNPQEH